MILVCHSNDNNSNGIEHYYFIKYPDNIVDYRFLNNDYLIDDCIIIFDEVVDTFPDDKPLKNIKITPIENMCDSIFMYYQDYKNNNELAEKILYQILECIPKEFIKWLCKQCNTSIASRLEKDTDLLYDEIMIKDIIE